MDSDDGSLPSPMEPPPELPADVPPPLPARPPKKQSDIILPLQDINNFDDNDEISQQMTASYSEISFKSGLSPENELINSLTESVHIPCENIKRPVTLCDGHSKPFGPLNLEGTVHVEGNMTHFVAEDLEYKIKLSTPNSKLGDTPSFPGCSRSGTPSKLYRQILHPQVGQVDVGLLNDLECEAQRMATSIDNLTENLCGILHSISSITADNVDVYKNAVTKMSDAMDSNIKSMYTLMAKTEEVTHAMKVVQSNSSRIKEIRRLVELFESYV